MGLFFEQLAGVPQDVVQTVMRQALMDPVPADAVAEAGRLMKMLGSSDPRLMGAIATALETQPPESEQAATQQAQSTAAALQSAPPRFYWGRATMAVGLFAVLAGMGFWADSGHHSTSSTAFFGFAGGVFGVVTALLSTEKARS